MTNAPHSERDHAKYAPSAAHRWIACRGSIKASEGIAETSSEAAIEGTECHEAASRILEGYRFEDATEYLTDEQIDIVEKYVDYAYYMFDAMKRKYSDARWLIETRVRAPGISPDFHGTADLSIIGGNLMRIIDLKGGWFQVMIQYRDGSYNPQLLSYILLSLAALGANIGPWDFDLRPTGIERVKMTIVQPRVYDDAVTADIPLDAIEEFKDLVIDTIAAIEAGDDKRVAGAHCKFCPARGRCPTLRDEAVRAAKMEFTVWQNPRKNFTPEQISAVIAEKEMIQAHFEGVEMLAYQMLMSGKDIPGRKLIPRRAIKKWIDVDRARRQAISMGLTGDKLYTTKLKTPTQLIKLAKAEGIEYDFHGYWEANSSGLKMVPADDPHEGVKVRPGDDFKD